MKEANMSIVIIGGHERMETQYKQICKQYKCKAKVFTKMKTDLKNKIGSPGFADSLYLHRFS